MVSDFDLSSLKEIVSAAAPLGEGLTQEFMDKVKIPIYQGKFIHQNKPPPKQHVNTQSTIFMYHVSLG